MHCGNNGLNEFPIAISGFRLIGLRRSACILHERSQMKQHTIPLERRIAGIFDARREQLAGYQVWLFGSRGRGHPRANSDYDIGILGAQPLDLPIYFEIQDAMEALPTLHAIDWVDLSRASKGLRENALKEGKLLYEG